MKTSLQEYIYECIVPQYGEFDNAHKEDHALAVIGQAMKLLEEKDAWVKVQESPDSIWLEAVDRNLLLTAAACHDLGLVNGRDTLCFLLSHRLKRRPF